MLASQNGDAAEDLEVLFKNCPEGAAFYELDLETGTVSAADAERSAHGCLLDVALSPWTARIFVMAKAGEEASNVLTPVQAFTRHPAKILRLKLDLARELPVSIPGVNVYRLEEMNVYIAGGRAFVSKPNTFIEHLKESGTLSAAQVKFSDGFGIPQRLSMNYPIQVDYHFEFILSRDLYSVADPLNIRLLRDKMGIMGGHTVVINRKELPANAWKPYRLYDQNNIAADITAFLKPGQNTMDVHVTATEDWHGLSDPLYLLGNFGVLGKESKFIIGRAPAKSRPSAKAVEGYPFYSGKFLFETELHVENPAGWDSFTVELPEEYRIYDCVELSVNGHMLGVRAFSPYIWQGSAGLLKQGRNSVNLVIANTLGNMLEGCYYDYEEHKTVFI
jgi:hypothetical protein